jgi:hypothetical protein
LVGKPEGKRSLGRADHRWDGNIRTGIRELGFVGVDWMHVAQERDQWRALVNAVMNI